MSNKLHESFPDSSRVCVEDKKIVENIKNEKLENILFSRLVSKEVLFDTVSFKYSIFDGAYLRRCEFKSCDFTGCRFINANLKDATFVGCKFDYATFDKTFLELEVLNSSQPSYENLKLFFARSLRTNFQSIGNPDGVNCAIALELEAAEIHLRKCSFSGESYYRENYTGLDRGLAFLGFLKFKLMDWLWGNGESAWKLLRTVGVVILMMTLYSTITTSEWRVGAIGKSLGYMLQVFFGAERPAAFSSAAISLVSVARLILFSFFMSIIIKRFNRR